MRAAFFDASGVIQVGDVETPSPGAGEVRVRVSMSGVNPTDWKTREQERPFPFQVPNHDGAGVIDAVGDGVEIIAGMLRARRHDTDDAIGLAVEGYVSPEYVRVGGKALAPQMVAQDDFASPLLEFVAGVEIATPGGGNAERAEIIRRNALPASEVGLTHIHWAAFNRKRVAARHVTQDQARGITRRCHAGQHRDTMCQLVKESRSPRGFAIFRGRQAKFSHQHLIRLYTGRYAQYADKTV